LTVVGVPPITVRRVRPVLVTVTRAWGALELLLMIFIAVTGR
jgi:hypothetical protein